MQSFARANRLRDFLNGVSGSVFAPDQRIALLGVIANEAAGIRIEFHPVAHPEGLILGIDSMGVQVADHLLDERLPTGEIPGRFGFFLDMARIASLVANIRKIAPSGRVMADLNVGVEKLRFAGPDPFDEVGLVGASAIAFELLDQLAIDIVSLGRPALAFQASGLAVHDVSAPGAGEVGGFFAVGSIGQVAQSDHDRDRAGIEGHGMDIGGLARVVPDHPSSAAEDPARDSDAIAEHDIADIV